jgi:hypothetical protein
MVVDFESRQERRRLSEIACRRNAPAFEDMQRALWILSARRRKRRNGVAEDGHEGSREGKIEGDGQWALKRALKGFLCGLCGLSGS